MAAMLVEAVVVVVVVVVGVATAAAATATIAAEIVVLQSPSYTIQATTPDIPRTRRDRT